MVHSDSEAESLASQDSVVSFSQQFEPQEDDEDTLWEVEKITAEKGKLYKVKWKGIDPKTMKPWTQSWVPKKDCTPDLVISWKKEMKEKDRRKSTASNRRRDSATSKKSGGGSVVNSKASTSKLSDGRRSVSTVKAGANDDITTARRGRSSATSTRMASTATPSNDRTRSKSTLGLIPDTKSYSEEEELPTPKVNAKGKKRKLAEANSATNSANLNIDVTVNNKGDAIEKRAAARPTKKRKVEVEIVKPEPESEDDQRRSLSISHTQSQSQPRPTQEEESYEVSKPHGKVGDEEENEEEVEEDEKMVEDALSQGINSPTPIRELDDEPDEDQRLNTRKGKGREISEVQESEVDELEEEPIVIASLPPKSRKNPTNGKSNGKTLSSMATTSGVANTSRKTAKKLQREVVPESSRSDSLPPSPKFGPPSRKSLAKTKSRPSNTSPLASTTATTTNAKPTTNPTKYPKLRAMQTSNTSRPLKRATPVSDSDSDTDSGPPQLVQSSPHSNHRAPTEERSIFWPEQRQASPVLSPAAQERLRLFDEEVNNEPGPSKAHHKRGETALSPHGQEEKLKESGGVPLSNKHQQVIDLVSPDGTPAPSSKASQPLHASGDGKVENERGPTEQEETNTLLPNESSALTMASRPRLSESNSNRPAVGKSSPASSDVEIESRPAAGKIPNESNQPGPSTATSKPKSTASSSSLVTGSGNGHSRMRSAKPSNNIEVIPETEEEGSQSQSQPLDLDMPTPVTMPYVSYPQRPTTPGGKNTLRSRMKPRTPLSRSSSRASHTREERPLGPIPELLPSVFHPHLPEPISSLPESITDPPTSGIRKDEEDATVSSIEDFDSPEKGRIPAARTKTTVTRKNITPSKIKERQKESAENVWQSDIFKRGQEIAEAAKRNSEAQLGLTQRPKKTLEEIRASRSRSTSNVSQLQRGFDSTQDKILEDEETHDISTAVVPPASGPRDTLEEESLTVQEMEEAYVDLNGGAAGHHIHHSKTPDPIALREEEEESTQDLMMDTAEHRMEVVEVERGPPDAAISESSHNEKNRKDTPMDVEGDKLKIPKIVVQDASQSDSLPPHSSEPASHAGIMRTTRSRSRSQTPFVASQVAKAKGKANTEIGTNKLGRTGSLAPPSRVSPLPDDRTKADSSSDEVQERLNAALALVNTKSDAVARLEAELSSQKIKNEELRVQADAQYQGMMMAIDSLSKESAKSNGELKQEVKDSETRLAELLAEKANWEAERARLTTEVESTKQSKVGAEKDREFFREQYAKASGFVSSIREENKDLEKRSKIAEEQATSGVALIKSTFELRVKTLENDLKSWRKMAEFLIDKDRRTDNDELRRRAAEHPELLARCARQERNLENLQEQLEDLNVEMEHQQRGWSACKTELQKYKQDFAAMHLELTEATTKLERLGRDDVDSSGVRVVDNGHEFVYCCRWRIYDGIESTSCREVFSTISGLEQHLLTGGHLNT